MTKLITKKAWYMVAFMCFLWIASTLMVSSADNRSGEIMEKEIMEKEIMEKKSIEKEIKRIKPIEVIPQDAPIQNEDKMVKDGILREELVLITPEKSKSGSKRGSAFYASGIEYFGKVNYHGYKVGIFTVNGEMAFCMEHNKFNPDTGAPSISEIYEDDRIKQILYGGLGGQGQWQGFEDEVHGRVLTSLALSHYYYGPSFSESSYIYTTGKLREFLNYCEGITVPYRKLSLTKTYATSFLNQGKTQQQTEEMTLSGDANNYINLSLPSGISCVNTTQNTTTTGTTQIHGNDTFYFLAPLYTSGSWSSGLCYGELGKWQAIVTIPTGNNQDLGQGKWVVDTSTPISFTIQWISFGKINLQKIDADSNAASPLNENYTLAGAVYHVYDSEGTLRTTMTTNTEGKATSELLPYGTYVIKEITPSNGYIIASDEHITINAEEVTCISKEVPQKGIVSIQKRDSETQNNSPQGSGRLEGATYTVTDAKGTIVEQVVTNENGQAITRELPLGTYQLQETVPPQGYNLDEKVYKVVVRTENSTKRVFYKGITSQEDIIRGDVEFYKFAQDQDGEEVEIKKPLSEVEFTLTHKTTKEKIVIHTDKKGKATTVSKKHPRGRLVYGIWAVEETKTPEGYKPIEPFTIQIDAEKLVIPFIIENQSIRACIQVEKTDVTTRKRVPLAGTTFKIIHADTGEDVQWTIHYPSTQQFVRFKTDEKGQCVLPSKLPCGSYALIELEAPNGYTVNKSPLEFKVDKSFDWKAPLLRTSANTPAKGKLRVMKKEEKSNKPLQGAIYSLTAKEDIVTPDGTLRAKQGEIVDTIVTGADGVATSLEQFLGTYELQEVKAPAGYVCSDKKWTVKFTYKDQTTAIVLETLEITNQPTHLEILKKIANQEMPLPGVTFEIWNKGMEAQEDPFDVKQKYITDKEGKIVIEYLMEGTYCIKEYATLPGYILDKTIHEIHVDAKGLIDGKNKKELVLENDFTKVQFSKQDSITKKELKGAKMRVLRQGEETKNICAEWISTEKPHIIEGLPQGNYILQEIQAPEGYEIASDIEFTVGMTGKMQTIIMQDKPKAENIQAVQTGDITEIKLYIEILGMTMILLLYCYNKRKKRC
ncbi:MAG: SpaA isopeptide-forming pilin-related protein [Lachnospiraceae bacterium]